MEKTFLRMKTKPVARHAYVQAEIATALAHQIRVIRKQRGMTQTQLARLLGTTQAAVSRLEDPSYGKVSLHTLTELARIFDTGLQVRFVSFVRMLKDTWKPVPGGLEVESFEDEAPHVGFDYPSAGTASEPIHLPGGHYISPAVQFAAPAWLSIAAAPAAAHTYRVPA